MVGGIPGTGTKCVTVIVELSPVQQRQSRSKDPLYRALNTLLTSEDLLSKRGRGQLEALFAQQGYQVVEATWKVYPRIGAAYRTPSSDNGWKLWRDMIHDLTKTLQEGIEMRSLAVTLKKQAPDILAYFAHVGFIQWTDRTDYRAVRASSRVCVRVQEPRELYREVPVEVWRIQTRVTPMIAKSRLTFRTHVQTSPLVCSMAYRLFSGFTAGD